MNPRNQRYLVIGADGQVGAGLVSLMQKFGVDVTATTRRSDTKIEGNRLYFDLGDPNPIFFQSSDYSVAFLCAAITSIATCERDPAYTYQINVLNTVVLAKCLLNAGIRIVFLSSNTIFDGISAWPNEAAPYSPICEYGRQKANVERQLLALSKPETPVKVVRLSKVIKENTGITADFTQQLRSGEECPAFNDLRICPISLDYTTRALLAIANANVSGIFHLSGEEEMSYFDFANYLANHLKINLSLVRPISLDVSSVHVVFRPEHPGLGMQRTQQLLGITPEPRKQLLSSIVSTQFQGASDR